MLYFCRNHFWRFVAGLGLVAVAVGAPAGAEAPVRDVTVEATPADDAPRLPDGYFSGPFFIAADDGSAPFEAGQLQIQIVHGFIVSAVAETSPEDGVISLRPMTAPDDPELRMNGRAGHGFIKVHGRFWDPRAAMGAFEGVIANKKARGVWSVTRR